jgi:hypothetical protein
MFGINTARGKNTHFMFVRHMAFEKMKLETMHVVPNFSFSGIDIVSDIVCCRECVWYGRTWRFGSWLYPSSESSRRVRIRREKHLLASSCLPARLSACISAAPTGRIFRGIWYWEILRKPVEKLHVWLKHFTWRPKHVYIIDSSMTARQQCIGKPLLHFVSNTEHFYDADSYM